MKKFLYCAAVVALATACTQEDDFLTAPSSQAQEQGLVLNATLANTDATTKGELYEDNKTYPFFWYAEQDRIDVVGLYLKGAITSGTGTNAEVVGFGTNATGKGVATLGTGGAWTLPTGFASYKATQSQGEGKFTAASDGDMLTLTTIESTDDAKAIEGKTATIIATYDGVSVAAATSQVNPLTSQAVPGSLTSLVLVTKESNATQNIDRPNQVDAPMWSVSSASRTDDYSSVGEKVDLQLKRPFPVLRFTTTGVDKFAKDFGPLKSVTLKTIGKNTDGKWDNSESGSALVYAQDKHYGVIGTQGWIKQDAGKWVADTDWKLTNTSTEFYNQATVNIASTDNWSDANSVYMTVAPVDRSKMTDGEMLVVTYNFQNITFTLDGSLEGAKDFEKLISKNSWTAFTADGRPNAVTKITPLDINNYNYLVVKNGSDYTLIVNKGKVGDVLNTAKTNVVWGNINPALTNIKKIVVNCDIEDADFANLNLFKNVAELELAEETSIPAKGLASFASVTTLTMPKVTTIDEDFLGELGTEQFTGLTNLNMAAYNFPTTVINEKFFNDQTKKSLKVLDMSGIEDMTAAWPLTRTINFDGYALTEVTVKDGVQLSPNAFANCAALATVNGKVTLMDNASATGAFFGAEMLKTINVTNSKVPADAFKKATSLENILVDGKQIVPTVVGESAFESTSALVYMDLSKVTTMGKYAFKNSGLKATSKDNNIIEVGISIAENEIFRNSKVEYVYFPNVTKINGNLFQSMTTLKQVKFGKEFTVAAVQAWTEPFGLNPELVDLFLVESMRGGDYWAEGSNNLVLPTVKADGKAGDPATISFRVIKVDDGSFGN